MANTPDRVKAKTGGMDYDVITFSDGRWGEGVGESIDKSYFLSGQDIKSGN